jgi:hypothetical protein
MPRLHVSPLFNMAFLINSAKPTAARGAAAIKSLVVLDTAVYCFADNMKITNNKPLEIQS